MVGIGCFLACSQGIIAIQGRQGGASPAGEIPVNHIIMHQQRSVEQFKGAAQKDYPVTGIDVLRLVPSVLTGEGVVPKFDQAGPGQLATLQ